MVSGAFLFLFFSFGFCALVMIHRVHLGWHITSPFYHISPSFFVTFWLLQLLLCYFVWRLAYIKGRVCVCVSLAKRDTPPACLTGWDIDRYSPGHIRPCLTMECSNNHTQTRSTLLRG